MRSFAPDLVRLCSVPVLTGESVRLCLSQLDSGRVHAKAIDVDKAELP